tara:strand:+ start:824 stop:1216 length:393 start_codon:yes stop_codon:yes gene_type:complete
MTLTKADFIWEAAYNLVGNTNGALFISGEPTYENIIWDTKVYTGTIPTKAEVETKAQALLDGEAMRRLREHRDNLLKETDWVVTKASETGVAETTAWKTYRQKLRDLPSSATPEIDGMFIKNVTWPTKPS